MEIKRQIEIIETQINSKEANFSLFEKLQYLNDFFKPDPEFTQEAIDIVIGNISKSLKEQNDN